MAYKLEQVQKSLRGFHNGSRMETFYLYSGMELSFLTLEMDEIALHHDALDHIMEINYCKSGRIGWKMGNGNRVYLGQGDFSLHLMSDCANSVMTLPNKHYDGIILCIDLKEFFQNPPELIAGTGITGELLREKFCSPIRINHSECPSGGRSAFAARQWIDRTFAALAGNEQSEPIFSAFYGQPERLRLAYWRVKALELLLYLDKLNYSPNERLTEYQSEQVEIVRNIHEQMVMHMDQRFTIESLSRQYLLNPTTLKSVFKAVYGNSIAAHVKEHRMEEAARRLVETQDSVAGIAQAVGYESQSKFTAAFKEYFQILPTEYRRQHETR